MSMRWMKLEGTTFCTFLLLSVFSCNKVKIVFFCLFSELSVQYKNTPKIKVLQMPCQFNMIFSGIFENIWHWEHSRGAGTWPRGSRACPPLQGAPPASWAHGGPLHLFLHPHTSSSSQKNHHPAQARVLAHFAAIFDLLAQSSIHKIALGIVAWYVTPPLVQLVFVPVLYSLQICAA